MPDSQRGSTFEFWRTYVRDHLDLSGLVPERQVEIVDEIAQLFGDAERDFLAQGHGSEASRRLAKAHVATWEELRADCDA